MRQVGSLVRLGFSARDDCATGPVGYRYFGRLEFLLAHGEAVGVALANIIPIFLQLGGHRLAIYFKGNRIVLSIPGNEHRVGAARLALALGIGYVCSWRGTCACFCYET